MPQGRRRAHFISDGDGGGLGTLKELGEIAMSPHAPLPARQKPHSALRNRPRNHGSTHAAL
jgi:hypothetical protein